MRKTVGLPQHLPVWPGMAMVLRDSAEPCCCNGGNVNSLVRWFLPCVQQLAGWRCYTHSEMAPRAGRASPESGPLGPVAAF